MARRSLKPQLNQIRAWVRQGRTDAWIAHQLEVSASELREFRAQHDLTGGEEEAGAQEIDLRDEIEAEIEAAAAEEEEEEEEAEEEAFDEEEVPEAEAEDEDEGGARRERAPRRRPREGGERESREDREPRAKGERDGGGERDGEGRPKRRRRRGRRGGRGRKRPEYEATFDHGERDGYGLWLDPTVKDNPVYAQHWAGKSEVTVRIDPDQIVIRRPGAPENADESDQ